MPDAVEVADRFEPAFRTAFLAMVERLSQTPYAAQVEEALRMGDAGAVIRLWEVAIADTRLGLIEAMVSAIRDPYMGGMALVSRFTVMNPASVAWIETRAGQLVYGIATDALLSIRSVLNAGYLTGRGARWIGRRLRRFVGMLPAHTAAVARYMESMTEQDLPADLVAHNVDLAAQRYRNHRAENIARTETMTAAHAGQMAGWEALIEQGAIDVATTCVEWMTTEDDRLCPYCAPMDGKRIRFGGLFVSDVKGFPDGVPTAEGPGSRRLRRTPIRPDPLSQPRDSLGRFTRIGKRRTSSDFSLAGKLVPIPNPTLVPHPPLHPNCRCTMRLRFE